MVKSKLSKEESLELTKIRIIKSAEPPIFTGLARILLPNGTKEESAHYRREELTRVIRKASIWIPGLH